MKKSILSLFLAVAFASSAVIVHADHHGTVETEKHEMKADVNGDGKVSLEEFKNARLRHMEEHFKRRDINNDGFIDPAEKKAAREKRKAHKKTCKRKKDAGK